MSKWIIFPIITAGLSIYGFTGYYSKKIPAEAYRIKAVAARVEHYEGDKPLDVLDQASRDLSELKHTEPHYSGLLKTLREIEIVKGHVSDKYMPSEYQPLLEELADDINETGDEHDRRGGHLYLGIYFAWTTIDNFRRFRTRNNKKFKLITSKRIT